MKYITDKDKIMCIGYLAAFKTNYLWFIFSKENGLNLPQTEKVTIAVTSATMLTQ